MVSADQVHSFLLSLFKEKLAAKGIDANALSDEFDLFDEGVIDSFGMLEMIAEVERTFSTRIDYSNMAPEELTVIGPFCRYVAAQAQ